MEQSQGAGLAGGPSPQTMHVAPVPPAPSISQSSCDWITLNWCVVSEAKHAESFSNVCGSHEAIGFEALKISQSNFTLIASRILGCVEAKHPEAFRSSCAEHVAMFVLRTGRQP